MGAAIGAVLRWVLSINLNSIFVAVPLGTLTANIIGGYLIGIALEYFGSHPSLPPELRLLVITGFLGGLTTFSTFSAEVVASITQGRTGWAMAIVAIHVLGSLAMTMLGMASVSLLRSA